MEQQKPEVDYREMLRQETAERRRSEIADISTQLAITPIANAERRRLEEHIFKNVFLPMFLGQPNPAVGEPIRIGNWTAFAGSPHAEVDVIDARGQVLFTVPPAYNAKAIAPAQFDGGTDGMKYVMNQTRLLYDVRPVEAEGFFYQEITQRATNMKSSDDATTKRYEEAWKKIFQFYNVNVVTDAPQTTAGKAPPATDYDYDIVPP